MKTIMAVAAVFTLAAGAAHADSCQRSRDYLMSGMASGDTTLSSQSYAILFKTCLAAVAMSNVKDAYILKDGGIAIIPKQDNVPATAATLSQFCDAYPRGILRFVTTRELLNTKSLSQFVQMSSTSATSCRKIKGL
jgi:hypothetical protein